MKMKAIKEMKKADLEKKLGELRAKLGSFRFGETGSKSKNTKQGLSLRKDIARILTVINK